MNDKLIPGARVELVEAAGYRKAGSPGVVVHACTNLAMVRFDSRDPYGARDEILEPSVLRSANRVRDGRS